MIAKILMLLGVTALSGLTAEASDGVSEVAAELLNMTVEEEPEQAVNLYEGGAYPRDENILSCLKEFQRCSEDAASPERPLCVAKAENCRALILATPRPPLPIQIEVRPPKKFALYKTLDLCGESFDVSKLHDAAATDADLALALRYMEQKGVKFSSYCFIDFYAETGARTLSFDPGRFERGEFLGSPSPNIPSYAVTIDDTTGKVTIGHYQK